MHVFRHRIAHPKRLLAAVALLVAGAAVDLPIAGVAHAANDATPVAPGSVVVGTASITYTARAGDTLISIAKQYTDRASNWTALGKLNRIDRDSAPPWWQ